MSFIINKLLSNKLHVLCAGTEPHSPYVGLVIYEFQMIPLLHSSQTAPNKSVG